MHPTLAPIVARRFEYMFSFSVCCRRVTSASEARREGRAWKWSTPQKTERPVRTHHIPLDLGATPKAAATATHQPRDDGRYVILHLEPFGEGHCHRGRLLRGSTMSPHDKLLPNTRSLPPRVPDDRK